MLMDKHIMWSVDHLITAPSTFASVCDVSLSVYFTSFNVFSD